MCGVELFKMNAPWAIPWCRIFAPQAHSSMKIKWQAENVFSKCWMSPLALHGWGESSVRIHDFFYISDAILRRLEWQTNAAAAAGGFSFSLHVRARRLLTRRNVLCLPACEPLCGERNTQAPLFPKIMIILASLSFLRLCAVCVTLHSQSAKDLILRRERERERLLFILLLVTTAGNKWAASGDETFLQAEKTLPFFV